MEVMLKSFRPNLTPLEARLAFLETVSHLEHLRMTGRRQTDERVRDRGVPPLRVSRFNAR